uniref:Putative secreted peptide n=1 Tax=Anopheles braziliensis TaxID=58242 RepID=A0A2M3ZP68_9DIPT
MSGRLPTAGAVVAATPAVPTPARLPPSSVTYFARSPVGLADATFAFRFRPSWSAHLRPRSRSVAAAAAAGWRC